VPEGFSFPEVAVNKRIEKMAREIERRGGVIVGLESVPDHIAEHFLREVLMCPDCAGAGRPQGESIDKILAGSSRTVEHAH
jgi:hypothetical protein